MDEPKSIAAIFALTGFAVAVTAGMTSGGDVATTLTRALITLPICFAVGLFAGIAIRAVTTEHINDYQSGRPIPTLHAKAPSVVTAQAEKK